ncbi:MAG: long-chain fatty acid--CoA ligase [Gammaproteobacteria bacterium]
METFPSLFLQQARTRSSDSAIRFKHHGLWKSWTWSEAESVVKELACGLAAKGLKPNEKVAIIGNNIPDLYFAMIAVQCLGSVPVPIHPDSNTKELVSFLNNCEAKFAMVQDQQQVDALYGVIKQCDNLHEVIYSGERGMREYDHTHLSSFEELADDGKKFSQEHVSFFDDVTSKVSQDTDAFILYTAGTSGTPRGAVHTHGSLVNTATAFASQEKITQDEQVLAFLPLSYAANALFTYTLWLLKGFTINCPESNDTVMSDLREIGPTLLYAPPHFYKQLYSEIVARAQRSNTKKFDMWFKYARQNRESLLNGNANAGGGLNSIIGNLMMFSPLKNVYGLSHIKTAYAGGDVISAELFNFFRGIGVNLKKCYGTAEAAGFICVQSAEQADSAAGEDTMGTPLAGVEIKQLADGEIAFKGTNSFREYYRDMNATAETIDSDGWIKTGDLGDIDAQGALKITDRVDSVGKFSSGDMFVPHRIEAALKSSPYIQEAVAVGEGQDSIAAFIVIDGVSVGSWAEVNNIRFAGYRDLAMQQEVYDLVKKAVEEVNANIRQSDGSNCPPIKRFVVMHREFNVDQGEITRSRKIKRDVVMGTHQALVNAMYSSQKSVELKDSTSQTVAELKIESA